MKNKSFLILITSLLFIHMNAQTKIIAHRGFSSIAPENTLTAFKKAIECNADYFELDVRKTKNNSVVVIHDSTVNRTSSNNKKGKVADFTDAEIAQIKVGYPKKFDSIFTNEKIPTLKDALQLAKGKIKVCIEIKDYGIEKEILDIINTLEVKNEVIIFSFYYPVLTKIRQLDSNIAILYLIEKANKHTLDDAKIINASAIGVGSKTNITKGFINKAHKENIEVWKWTVNKKEEMKNLIQLGLDGLITNFPDKAIQIQNKIKLSKP